jgi:hypothetical protein
MTTPWIRTFHIDGQETTSQTYRTAIISHYVSIKEKTFIDLGSGDACESRALAAQGAKQAVAVEGKEIMFSQAKAAQDYLNLPNHEVLPYDVRKIDTYGLKKFDIVTCFGFLYHMTNPFNVLKRIKNVTGELLLLETHIAPRHLDGLTEKILACLSFDMHRVKLDGRLFDGKLVPHVDDATQHKGTLDSNWTFWLTLESLFEALIRAGFIIQDFHYELDKNTPAPLQKWGTQLGFGHGNAKVWIAAAPQQETTDIIDPPTEHIVKGTPFWVDTPIQLANRLRLVHPQNRMGWIKRTLKGWSRLYPQTPVTHGMASQETISDTQKITSE